MHCIISAAVLSSVLSASEVTTLRFRIRFYCQDPLLLSASQRPSGCLHVRLCSCIMTKRALVVGCNYPGSPHQLAGCANDASSICSLLREVFDYKPQNMLMMVDSDPQAVSPTGANIKVGSCLSMLLTCSTTDA